MWSIITVIIIIFVIVRELKKSRSQRENNSSFSDVEKSDPKDSKDSKEEKKYPKAPLYEELLQAENMELSGNIIIFDKEIKNTNSNYCKQLLNRYISEIESNNFLQRNPFDKLQVEIKNNNDQILQKLEFYGTPTARTRYFYDNSGILRLTYHSSQGETREITLYETLSNQNYRKLSLYRDSDEKNFRVYSVEEENQEKQKIFSYEYYDAGGGDYRLYQRKYNLDNSSIELDELSYDRGMYGHRDLTKYDALGRKINMKSYANYTEKLSDDKLVSETNYFYDERGNEIEERTYFYETEKMEKHLKEFDEHNNLIHEILKDGAERIYKYDSNNNLTYEKNCFQETYYSYDKENRCVLRKTTKNGITRYHYNKDGTISIEYEDNDGNVTEHLERPESFSGELNHTFTLDNNKGEVAINLSLKEFGPINLPVQSVKF